MVISLDSPKLLSELLETYRYLQPSLNNILLNKVSLRASWKKEKNTILLLYPVRPGCYFSGWVGSVKQGSFGSKMLDPNRTYKEFAQMHGFTWTNQS